MKKLVFLFFLSLFAAHPSGFAQRTVTCQAGGVSFEMVSIPGGKFTMGATPEQGTDSEENEIPAHDVTLTGFYIGKDEVSQGLWKAVMGGNNPSLFQGDDFLPVESVSYEDCLKFISRLNAMTGKVFRLPTEAEWEYAARNANMYESYKYPTGQHMSGWHKDNSKMRPQESNYGTTQLGLVDMSGNVWEWCSDWMGTYSASPQQNPKGPASGTERVCRGGGWGDFEWRCRVSSRGSHAPGYKASDLGLRLAMSLPKTLGRYPVYVPVNKTYKKEKETFRVIGILLDEKETEVRVEYKNSRTERGLFGADYSTVSKGINEYIVSIKDIKRGKSYPLLRNEGNLSNVYGHGTTRQVKLFFQMLPEDVESIDIVFDKETTFDDIDLIEKKKNKKAPQQTDAKTVTPVKVTDSPVSYIEVETKPLFNGKDANEFAKWVRSQLVYPEGREAKGRVTLGFVIDFLGNTSNVQVLHTSGDSRLDAEAVRVVSKSPKWTPGKHQGKTVDVSITFPVIFQ